MGRDAVSPVKLWGANTCGAKKLNLSREHALQKERQAGAKRANNAHFVFTLVLTFLSLCLCMRDSVNYFNTQNKKVWDFDQFYLLVQCL